MKTEFTKWEWFEVAKLALPDLSIQVYEQMWADFVELKRQHGIHLVDSVLV